MNEPDLSAESRPPSPRFVLLMILLSVLLFLVASGFLALRWLRTTEPAAELLVVGNEALAGAQASVRAVDEATPYTSTFGHGGRFTLPFYLDPGAYMVRVTFKDGQVIHEQEVSIRAKEQMLIDLSKWERKIPSTTAPAPPFAPAPAPAGGGSGIFP